MSTANEPDDQKTDGAGSSASTESSSASGTTRPAVVPPWQRGQSESTAPGAQRAGQVDNAPGAQRAGQVDNAPGAKSAPAGPPPRGVVSGTPGESERKPLNKLDATGAKAGTATSGDDAKTETFVESPTRNIDRAGLATQNLPDLDAIHHVDAAKPAKASPSSTRSGPTQVGSGRALRASVQVRRIDPWAMFKISAVLS
ncbi:hypothetical protein GOEFS_022_00640, partial [Gordonia effusa NBRC 100432]